jgi:predicted nuclease of predicted toxin-antitoxin system
LIRRSIDENLPAALAAKRNCPCIHAAALGEQATDKSIGDNGRREGWTLLTKGTEFFDRLALEGPPPKVIWLRAGNLRRANLETRLVNLWPRITALSEITDLVEIHTDWNESIKLGGQQPVYPTCLAIGGVRSHRSAGNSPNP